jgi:gas vesicle protein
MVESQRTLNNQGENINRTTTDESCVGPERTNIGAGISSPENVNRTTTEQPRAGTEQRQYATETRTENGRVNPALSRALIGGLIGATLGSLAGALAGRRIGEGFNRTIKGVGDASKTIGEGLGYTAKGLGDVAKSVAEGASYAVVGDTFDTAQGVTEGMKQTAVGTMNAVQKTVQDVNQAVQDSAEKTKNAAENTRPSEQVGYQPYNQTVTENQQTRNEQMNMGQPDSSDQSIYISSPELTEGYVSGSATFVGERMSEEPFEDNSLEEEINRIDS